MDLLSFLPSLPVGLVRWHDPRALTTIVVKATYELAAGRDAVLCRVHEPLSLDRVEGGELRRASDFVPRKRLVDVVVVGDACAAAPATSIPIRLAGHGIDKRAVATSSMPAPRIALSRASLGGVMLGPVARADARSQLPDAPLLSAAGPPLAPLRSDFDYAFFNAAPSDQRLGAWPVCATFFLEGVLASGEAGYARFPDLEPALYVVEGERVTRRVVLRCDTVCFLGSRAALTFRADVPSDEAPRRLVLGLATRDGGPSAAELAARLHEAVPVRAVEARELASPVGGATVAAPSGMRAAPLPFQAGDVAAPASTPPEAPRPSVGSGTVAAVGARAQSGKAMPFGPPVGVARAPKPAGSAAVSTAPASAPVSAPVSMSGGLASSRQRDPLEATSAAPSPSAQGEVAAGETLALTGQGAPSSRAHPFAAFGPAVSVTRSATPSVTSVPASRLDSGTIAVLPTRAPPSEAAVPFDSARAKPAAAAVPLSEPALPAGAPRSARVFTVADWGALVAALWAEPRARARVLARHDLDEAAFRACEARMQADLARDAAAGEHERILELGRAVERARAAEAPPRALSLDEYVSIRAALDVAPEAARVLGQNELSAVEWERHDRQHQGRAAADAEYARDLATRLRAVRRELALRRGRPGAASSR